MDKQKSSFYLELHGEIKDDPNSIMVTTVHSEDETIINFIKSLPSISTIEIYANKLVTRDEEVHVYERKYESFNKFTHEYIMSITHRKIVGVTSTGLFAEPVFVWNIDGYSSEFLDGIINVLWLKYKDNGATRNISTNPIEDFNVYIKNKPNEEINFNVSKAISSLYEELGCVVVYGGTDINMPDETDERIRYTDITNIYSFGTQRLIASVKEKMIVKEIGLSDHYIYDSTILSIYDLKGNKVLNLQEKNIHTAVLEALGGRYNDICIERIENKK